MDDHLLAIDAMVSLGQEVLQGKVNLSHRCFALAAWDEFCICIGGSHVAEPLTSVQLMRICNFAEEFFLANLTILLCCPSKFRKYHKIHLGNLGETRSNRMLLIDDLAISPLPVPSFTA